LLVLAGALFGAMAAGLGQAEEKHLEPRLDDAASVDLSKLIERGDRLVQDKRWSSGRDTAEWIALEADHYALLRDCAGFEDACRREMEANPGTLSHQYLYLWARLKHNQALETVLGHELEQRGYGDAAGRTGQRYGTNGTMIDDGLMDDFRQLVRDRQ
jgi:hypothetical protein